MEFPSGIEGVTELAENGRSGIYEMNAGSAVLLPAERWVLAGCLSGTCRWGDEGVGLQGMCRGFFTGNRPSVLKTDGQVLWVIFDKSPAHGLPDDISAMINPMMLDCIRSIRSNTWTGAAKCLMLEAKSLEWLALLLEAGTNAAKPYRHCRTEYDRERLCFARDYLLSHFDFPPTIPELARIAGINEYKLKNGFKELTGNTIHQFVLDHKLSIASRDLLLGEKKPNQLAFDLGFSSLQHFSKAFKKHYGAAPGKMKRPE